MRILFSLLALVAASCATAPPALDPIAEAYVRMSLEIGTHEEGYIDSYIGPPEWKTQAESAPRSVADLKLEADRLTQELEAVHVSGLERIMQRRVSFLLANVKSARFRLDMIEGTRVPLADEAERLFAIRPELRRLESYEPALARIEALVPGEGPLATRVEAFRAHYVVPADRVRTVIDAAIAECRRRTALHITLPPGERFTMELVQNQSWSGYNWYQGDNQSLIQINTDLPTQIGRALGVACHEGYPGHHVQGMAAEKLYRERGWVEFSVQPLFGPLSPLNEGGANFGVDLAFPGPERAQFVQTTLYPLAGLDPATAPAYEELSRAIEELAGAQLTIASMYLGGEIDRARASELIQRYQLTSPERASQSLDFIDHYRSYIINYSTGEDIVRAYVRAAGDADAQWAAYESIFSEPTIASDLVR
jgi:hypothetical protein